MELWIRSQDKKCLMPVNRIDIDTNGKTIVINGFETIIGKYETEERALEVLDEIQQKIKTLLYLKPNCLLNSTDIECGKKYFEKLNKQEFITCDNNFEIIPISTNTIVYEMPEK